MTLYTLRLHMADGSVFAYTETYVDASDVRRDIRDGYWVHPDIRDRRSSTGSIDMHVNPKQVCFMEQYAEGEEMTDGNHVEAFCPACELHKVGMA